MMPVTRHAKLLFDDDGETNALPPHSLPLLACARVPPRLEAAVDEDGAK